MRESEIMFRVGWISIAVVAMLLSTLQVCYETQNDARSRVRAQIVDTQQEIAVGPGEFRIICSTRNFAQYGIQHSA